MSVFVFQKSADQVESNRAGELWTVESLSVLKGSD